MTEAWLPIPGHEGRYEVSDLGRVRSLDRRDRQGQMRRGRVLSPVSSRGYLRVDLSHDGVHSQRFVHSLVLEAFVSPRPDGMQACHGDNDPTNNTLVNLRWDTPSANNLDKVTHGTHPQANITHCPAGHAYAGENLGMNRDGTRWCRACRRARDHEYRAAGRDRRPCPVCGLNVALLKRHLERNHPYTPKEPTDD